MNNEPPLSHLPGIRLQAAAVDDVVVKGGLDRWTMLVLVLYSHLESW